MSDLTACGPGKFSWVIDRLAYENTLNGTSEEIGDVEGPGWYGKIEGPLDLEDFDRIRDLTTADWKYLYEHSAGCIVQETNQGFVCVGFYDNMRDLEIAWGEMERYVNNFEGEVSPS